MIALAVICGALLAGLLYQAVGTARDRSRYPPPGRLFDVGGHRLHLHLTGAGDRTVVIESGIAASSVSWQLVRPEIAKIARVCTYDRAGLGWSESAPGPRTINSAVRDLRALLTKAGLQGPFLLVGHSFGGLAVLEYAYRYRAEVAGLVLVDPLTAIEWCSAGPEQLAQLQRGARLARRGALLARLGVVRLSLDLLRAGSRRIPKLAARIASSRGGSSLTERLVGEVRKLPPELWPVIQSHWCQPKSFLSMASHLESLPASAVSCRELTSLDDLPITVLSASDASPQRAAEHARIASLSTKGKRIVAERSGHWIQLDEPELVVESVRATLVAAR